MTKQALKQALSGVFVELIEVSVHADSRESAQTAAQLAKIIAALQAALDEFAKRED